MNLYLAPGAGIWCPAVGRWDDFRAALRDGQKPPTPCAEPVPALLPEREGRRAPLHVRIALEAAAQACAVNGLPLTEPITVFASSMGDSSITDYMCRALAAPSPMLSPTRFHNSVHNAASGYWSIGAGNRRSSVAIAAPPHTFTAGLLEAATLAMNEREPVLLVSYDVEAPPPLAAVCPNRVPCSTALLLAREPVTPWWRRLELRCRLGVAEWPEPGLPWLQQLALDNECARGLPVLEALTRDEPRSLSLPLAGTLVLELAIGRPAGPATS